MTGIREVGVVAGDWLRPLLAAGGDGVVVGVGPRAAYVALAGRTRHDTTGGAGDQAPAARGRVLAVEGHDAVGLPNGLRLAAPDVGVLSMLAVGDPVAVDRRGMVVDGRRPVSLCIRRWRRTRPRLQMAPSNIVARRLATLAEAEAGRGVVDARLSSGADHLAAVAAGRVVDPDMVTGGIDRMLGWGPGSTPSGDDVIAGFLGTHVAIAAGRACVEPVVQSGMAIVVRHLAAVADSRTTALSTTLLACAVDGALAQPAAGFLQALTGPDSSHDRVAAARVRLGRVGHSSGDDLAVGMLAAVSWWIEGRDPGRGVRVATMGACPDGATTTAASGSVVAPRPTAPRPTALRPTTNRPTTPRTTTAPSRSP